MGDYIAFDRHAFDEWFKNLTRAGQVVCPVEQSVVLSKRRHPNFPDSEAPTRFESPWVLLGAPK